MTLRDLTKKDKKIRKREKKREKMDKTKDKKTTTNKKTKIKKGEFKNVMSGQFCTLAMFDQSRGLNNSVENPPKKYSKNAL